MHKNNLFILCLETPNLGDHYNEFFFNMITTPDYYNISYTNTGDIGSSNIYSIINKNDIIISGIGSILHDTIKIYEEVRKIIPTFNNFYIFSSGTKYPLHQAELECLEKENIISLRGPLTSSYNDQLCFGDFGLYLNLFKNIKRNHKHEYEIGIIPHAIENDESSKEIQYIFNVTTEHPNCNGKKKQKYYL